MPITDLQRPPSFPLIGRLRKGAPKGEFAPGKDLEYLRFESEGNSDPGLVAKFESIYGATPRAIRVFMPYPTLDENFSAWREHRSGTKLYHTCDGYHEWRRVGGKLTKTDVPCPTFDLQDRVKDKKQRDIKNPAKCQPVGRLSMIVRGLGRFGYVMLTTGSVIDIARLTAELGAIELMAGHLNDIPMVLHRVPEKIPTQMGENRGLVTKYMLHIEIDAEWAALRLESMGDMALIDAMAPRGALAAPAQALPAPRTIEHPPAPITHNGYAVNLASGEIMAEPDDDDTEYEIDPEPAPPPAADSFVPLLTPAEIKDSWRRLEAAGVAIPTKFWSLALESFSEKRTREAMAWIAARQAELDNAAK